MNALPITRRLTCCLALILSFSACEGLGGGSPDGTPTIRRITIEPDPPAQGGKLDVSHDFSGEAPDNTVLRVRFEPALGSSDHEVSTGAASVTIDVPREATFVSIEDLKGPSPRKVAPVRTR